MGLLPCCGQAGPVQMNTFSGHVFSARHVRAAGGTAQNPGEVLIRWKIAESDSDVQRFFLAQGGDGVRGEL